MPKIVDLIKREHEEEHALLRETAEEAHAHTLWIRRMESQQAFLEQHFPDNHITRDMVGLLQRLRSLAGRSLGHKE